MQKYRNVCVRYTLDQTLQEDNNNEPEQQIMIQQRSKVLENFFTQCQQHSTKFVIGQIEIGDQTHRKHFHAVIHFTSQKTITQLKKIFGDIPHFDQMKGTWQQAVNYATKNGTAYEEGKDQQAGQGCRNDIRKVLHEANSYEELLLNEELINTVAHGRQVLKDYYLVQQRQNQQWEKEITVIWIAGSTGCGKSHYVREWCKQKELKPCEVWYSSNDLKWFDGFNGQQVAVFDDFRKEMVSFNFLLRLMDIYPLEVPVKNGFKIWNPKYLFITCPRIPEEEFVKHTIDGNVTYEDVHQVTRRCKSILLWVEKTNPVTKQQIKEFQEQK